MQTFSIEKKSLLEDWENPEISQYYMTQRGRLLNELQQLNAGPEGLLGADYIRQNKLIEEEVTAQKMDSVGLYQSVITVHEAPFAHPRAYITYPAIYPMIDFDRQGKRIVSSRIMVRVPDGYNLQGHSIRPSVDFQTIAEEDAKQKLNTVFGSPFAGPELTIMSITPRGTIVPENYVRNDRIDQKNFEDAFPWGDKEVFVLDTADSESAEDFINITRTKTLREQAQFIPYGESHIVIAFNKGAKIPESMMRYPQIDVKTYAWMREDHEDAQMNREMPPMPQAVEDDLLSAGIDITKYRSWIRKFNPL